MLERVRVHSQCVPKLRELRDSIDKVYSRRAASQLAIPPLLYEINILGDPREAEGRLRWMVDDRGLARTIIKMKESGDELLFLGYLGQILCEGDEKNSRPWS